MHAIVVDLGYGDAGKGTIVDWLCSPAKGGAPVHTVVRFNGGAQAAHNVITSEGLHHTFAQFGSGTFRAGVRTHLSRFVLVDPMSLIVEAEHLAAVGVRDPLDMVTVDRDALLVTPYHRFANRAREIARGTGRHGSCGMGIGETMAYALANGEDAPRVGDSESLEVLRRKLARLRLWLFEEFGPVDVPDTAACTDAFRAFAQRMNLVDHRYLRQLLRRETVVFEGAQGVLLDEWHGFHPYITWSTTTFANAETLLAEAGMAGSSTRLGVLRTYATRHGPGPFVTEDDALTRTLPDRHNTGGQWQGPFRVGHFDTVATRYALEVCGGVDGLALTHLDVGEAHPELAICRAYKVDGRHVDHLEPGPAGDLETQERLTHRLLTADPVLESLQTAWVQTVTDEMGVPVLIGSYGGRAADKRLFAAIDASLPAA